MRLIFMAEPIPTALLLASFGVLLVASVLFSGATQRVSIPAALLFLVIGVLAGSEGIGRFPFSDYQLAFRLGTTALVLILFDGGLNTPRDAVRDYAAPAAVLATVGVAGTAAIVGVAAHLLGFAWPQALLLGAIVSSTDAAAVFSVLRGSGIQLKRRVGATLELESGMNDPVAVLLTVVLMQHALAPEVGIGWRVLLDMVMEIVIGGAVGAAIGLGARHILARIRLPAGGLYPALTLGVALLAFAVPVLLHGSGFLAVYVAGVILGNGALPYRGGLLRVHDALAWLAQIAMFLVLGLLAFPSRLIGVAGIGLVLALVLAIVARPIVVAICLIPFRHNWRDTAYVAWTGLRGAVPIILAIYPVLGDVPGARRIFDVVFIVVVVNALVPGATVAWVARRLGLESDEPPAPPAVLEIESRQQLRGDLLSFYIDEALAVTGLTLAELPFPEGAGATLLVRGDELIPPRGATVLLPGDHLYVFSHPEDRPFIQLMFGRPETE